MPRRGEWAWRRPLSISGTSERCLDVSPESTMGWFHDVFVSWTWGRRRVSLKTQRIDFAVWPGMSNSPNVRTI
jgi:hypothetical protein